MLKERFISLVVDRLGFVPACEATLPLHDICHIFDDISTHGLIRYRNLFKYERMNNFMKQLLKNRARGLASIMKNYNTHERTTMSGSIYLNNVVKFNSLCRYQPTNGLPFHSLGSYINSIHVDVDPADDTGKEKATLYDIPSSNVIEFRGSAIDVTLSYEDINYLLAENVDVCYADGSSVLKFIMEGYYEYCSNHPYRFKDDMLGYMKYLLDGSRPAVYQRVVGNPVRRLRNADARQQAKDDLEKLRSLVVDMNPPQITVRFVYEIILIFFSKCSYKIL